MAAASLADIRQGIANAISNAVDTTQVSVFPYMKDSPPDRCIQVMGPDAIQYDELMARGADRWTIVVQAFSGSPEEQAAQTRLDSWLAPSGSESIKAAIEADFRLGGKVQSARVIRSSGYRQYDLPNRGRTLGAEFFIDVLNTGT